MWRWLEHKKKEKGQDIIEYALLLALVVGVGGTLYASGGLPDSISSIFSGAGSLLQSASTGVSPRALTILEKLVAAKGSGLESLNGNQSVIGSYEKEGGLNGVQISRDVGIKDDMLNFSTDKGSTDAWFVMTDGTNTYTVYYDPTDNGGVSFLSAKENAQSAYKSNTLSSLPAVNISYAITDASGNTTYHTGTGQFMHTTSGTSNVSYYIQPNV